MAIHSHCDHKLHKSNFHVFCHTVYIRTLGVTLYVGITPCAFQFLRFRGWFFALKVCPRRNK
jgi:hypothetical protein